jgi:exodeoxyribonuclease VII large subunit
MTKFDHDLTTAPVTISVSGLVDYIKATLEDDPTLRQVWVVGEVSSANNHTKGLFFTLTDLEDNTAINCVAWRSQLARLSNLPGVGEQVTVLGTVRVYPQRSSYQLMVWQVFPTGDGLKALRRRQLRLRLEAEGLFDPEFKRPLPTLPRAIAVVSSPQAAAWGDIQRSLGQHHPGLWVLFSPATVQGDTAPASIVAAIHRVVEDGRAEVLILARGGGATEDLDCFDDERVVRAVATCPIPVVTGIGHQRDETLADLAADVCAHTPTAAAVTAVPALVDLLDTHRQRQHHIAALVTQYLTVAQADQQLLTQRLQRLRLDQYLAQQQTQLSQLQQRLIRNIQVELRQRTERCRALRDHLSTLDPETVIQRGYALVRDNSGQVLTDVTAVTPDQELRVQLARGHLTARVTKIQPLPESPAQNGKSALPSKEE